MECGARREAVLWVAISSVGTVAGVCALHTVHGLPLEDLQQLKKIGVVVEHVRSTTTWATTITLQKLRYSKSERGLSDEVWRGCNVSFLGAGSCDFKASSSGSKVLCFAKNGEFGRSLGEKEEEDGSCNQLTSLRILELWRCENLERCKLPNNIQELSIYSCDSIASVSFPIVGGHKLKSLRINECEQLLEKELLNPSMPAMLENFPPSLVDLELIGGPAEEDDVSSGSQLSHMLPSSLTKLQLWEFGKKIEDLPEKLLPSLLTLKIWDCPDNLKEKIRMGFESSVNFNNQIYMPSSVPLSIISEKAYTFVLVNMNLPGNFFDVTVIGL
ncbi:NB-ARC domains-containing protein, partial [Tanacetum coccineum]